AQHRWIISQIGARQHYGVPRGFQYKGTLRLLYTDAWCPPPWRNVLRHGTSAMRAFAGRYHPDIPKTKVVSFTPAAVMDSVRAAIARRRGIVTKQWQHLEY